VVETIPIRKAYGFQFVESEKDLVEVPHGNTRGFEDPGLALALDPTTTWRAAHLLSPSW
jgi:hypothetical protein